MTTDTPAPGLSAPRARIDGQRRYGVDSHDPLSGGYAIATGLGMASSSCSYAAASASLPDQGIQWNYTTWLNIVALTLAALAVWRFVRTGGVKMLTMMGGKPR